MGHPFMRRKKVEHLMDHITYLNKELNAYINICRLSHYSTFVKESTYLSTVYARLYPPNNPSSGCLRKRNIYLTGWVTASLDEVEILTAKDKE